jgi:hypothetical protein
VIVLLKYVVPVATLMILCAIVLENVILAEQMLVAVRDGLVVIVGYGIVRIVRKATKTFVKNVDLITRCKKNEVKTTFNCEFTSRFAVNVKK